MKKRSTGRTVFCLIIVFLFSISSIYARENELRPYKLINADKLIVSKVNGEYVTNLIGNVHFFYGDTEFYSDKADLFDLQKIARMNGNVKVYDDTLSLFADKVDYFRETEKLFLEGNVFTRETHSDSTIRTFAAERVEYFRNEREFYAFQNVESFDEREDLYGECGKLIYRMNDGYGYMMQEPMLRKSGEDSLQVSAQKIEYFKDYEKIIATFDVDSFSSDFHITSDFLLYFSQEEKAIYLGEPEFSSDFGDASAIEFQLFFRENKMEKAILIDSCRVDFITEEKGEKQSWVTADLLEIHFDEGKINFCDAKGNVDSYYFQAKTEKHDLAVNNAQGAHLIITINDENRIETIDLRQNAQGMYKFQKK